MCHKLKESALPYHSRVGGKGLARRVISGKGGDPIRLANRKYPARGMAKQQAQLGFFLLLITGTISVGEPGCSE